MMQILLHNMLPYNIKSTYLKGKSNGILYCKLGKLNKEFFQQYQQVHIDIPQYITRISDEFLEGFLSELISATETFSEFKSRVGINTAILTLGGQVEQVYRKVKTSIRRFDGTKSDKVGTYIDFVEVPKSKTEVIQHEN